MPVRFPVSVPLQLRITSAEISHSFGTLIVLPLHCIPFAWFYAYTRTVAMVSVSFVGLAC